MKIIQMSWFLAGPLKNKSEASTCSLNKEGGWLKNGKSQCLFRHIVLCFCPFFTEIVVIKMRVVFVVFAASYCHVISIFQLIFMTKLRVKFKGWD